MRYISFLFVVILLSSPLLYAGSPREDFFDGDIFKNAISDIGKMSLEETECFISYLASCNAQESRYQKFYCDRDREIFLIKYERNRAIDGLVHNLKTMWMWVETRDKNDSSRKEDREELVKVINRYVDIMTRLQNATNRHYRSLTVK